MRRVLSFVAVLVAGSAQAGDVQPLDGLWHHSSTMISEEGCPPALIEHMMQDTETRYEFSRPFHASDRLGAHYVMERVRENTWEGYAIRKDVTDAGRIGAESRLTLTIRSETEMHEDVTFNLATTGTRGQDLGMAGETCEARWDVNLTWRSR